MTTAAQSPPVAPEFAATAQLCAAAAAAAYLHGDIISGRGTNTQVLITRQNGCLVIAFRGTQEIQDWITDARFELESFFYGKIHSGCKEAVYDVLKQIRAVLDEAGPTLPVYVCGHSLGGQEAVACAAMLQYYGYRVASVFTFGQPRVGNAEFANAYDLSPLGQRTYRFVNGNDIVPRLPGALLGYRHCGLDYFFSEQGALELNPKLWAMALSDGFGFWEDWRKRHELSLLSEHAMSRYLQKVNALA